MYDLHGCEIAVGFRGRTEQAEVSCSQTSRLPTVDSKSSRKCKWRGNHTFKRRSCASAHGIEPSASWLSRRALHVAAAQPPHCLCLQAAQAEYPRRLGVMLHEICMLDESQVVQERSMVVTLDPYMRFSPWNGHRRSIVSATGNKSVDERRVIAALVGALNAHH